MSKLNINKIVIPIGCAKRDVEQAHKLIEAYNNDKRFKECIEAGCVTEYLYEELNMTFRGTCMVFYDAFFDLYDRCKEKIRLGDLARAIRSYKDTAEFHYGV